MITIYGGGPNFGLPDASPFVVKADMLFKLAGVPHENAVLDPKDFGKTPKGKIPFIVDGDKRIGDSTFIRFYLEQAYGADFNLGMTPSEIAHAWALEKMVEDQIYYAIVHERWAIPENFDKGPRVFFDAAPALIRPFIRSAIRKDVLKSLKSHGFGRHSRDEVMILAKHAIEVMAISLGDRAWFGGEDARGIDATMGAFVMGLLCPSFDTPLVGLVAAHPNLVAYEARVRARFGY
jgi:glutathione S-transferase